MKTHITILLLAIQSIIFSQEILVLNHDVTALEFELSKVEIILHSFDSIEINSTVLDSINFQTEILDFNIYGVDANGNILFTKDPKSNKIPPSFKAKYNECFDGKFVRVKSIKLAWTNGGTYTPRKSKQWKIVN